MRKFTPGPWKRIDLRPDPNFDLSPGSMDSIGIMDTNLEENIAFVNPANPANARLISAAPEMLEALIAIKESCPCDDDVTAQFSEAWTKLEFAILKAMGES